MSGTGAELRHRAVGLAGRELVRALFATVRVRTGNEEAWRGCHDRGEPVIYVFWHDQLLPLVWVHRAQGIVVLVSEHDDGEYIARVIEGHGFATARGSSTRGGSRGLRDLVRAGRAGRDLAVTPDGPRGPRHRFKPGALQVARLTGLPLVPIAVAATSAWRLASWDRFLVPRPLSTVRVLYGDPHRVPRNADRDALRAHARTLTATLNRLTERAAAGGGKGRPVASARSGRRDRAAAG